MTVFNIDLTDVEAATSTFKAIPDGDYPAMLTDAEYKATKSNTGMCLHLKFRITGGAQSGRELRDFLTLEHETSKQATDIAKSRLKQLALAVGAPNPDKINDTDELCGPVTLTVSRKKDSSDFADEDGFVNSIKAYKEKHEAESSSEPVPF